MKPCILYIQYTNPAAYPPLEHSARAFAAAGWEVVFLGIAKDGEPPLRWPARDGIRTHKLPAGRSGWLRKLHYAWFGVWVLGWTIVARPRCVYASDALAAPVVLPLSFWPWLKVVYHEHDAPQVRKRGLARRVVLWARRRLAARADARILPNERRAREFVQTVANQRPTFSVWNCPVRAEVAPARRDRSGDGLTLAYVGSIVPVRLPTSLLEALAKLPDDVRLRVIGYVTQGHPHYADHLRRLANDLRIADRVDFVQGMPHQHLLINLRDADIGTLLMPSGGAQWMPGASNKPFDYLAGGLALLVSDEPGWREMLVEPGYGIGCKADDPEKIADAVRWFLQHRGEMRDMGERGRQRVLADWNYETQFAPVQQWLER
jgi:glycosyltransferase involved in cell wall biosynthesis